eukprot:g6905.t1
MQPGAHPKWDYAVRIVKEFDGADLDVKGPLEPPPEAKVATTNPLTESAVRQVVDALQTLAPHFTTIAHGARLGSTSDEHDARSSNQKRMNVKPKQQVHDNYEECQVSKGTY